MAAVAWSDVTPHTSRCLIKRVLSEGLGPVTSALSEEGTLYGWDFLETLLYGGVALTSANSAIKEGKPQGELTLYKCSNPDSPSASASLERCAWGPLASRPSLPACNVRFSSPLWQHSAARCPQKLPLRKMWLHSGRHPASRCS